MKIAIDRGHNLPGIDTGAGKSMPGGLSEECVRVNEIASYLISDLKKLGHEIIDCFPAKARSLSQSLATRCYIANKAKADIFISLHLNSFNDSRANGVETLIYSHQSQSRFVANRVQRELVSLGYTDRKVRYRPGLYILKRTRMPALLIEYGFVSSPKDRALFDAKKLSNATIKGLFPNANLDVEKIPITSNPESYGKVALQVTERTIGKPETDQSPAYDPDSLVFIPKGLYEDVEILCDEEGHYLCLFPLIEDGQKKYIRSYHWIYKGHCRIAASNT